MSPTGELTVLYHHPGVWCEFSSNVIQGTNGSFYGMINPYEGMCSELENAIAFTFNPGGPLTNLHTFEVADGYGVYVPIEATDGNLYGLAGAGGTNGSGTIYRLGPSGDFAVMYNFEDLNSFPSGMLVQHTNGLLYGVTRGGGKYRSGTVFSLDIGAAPFARPRARSAKILASSDKALPEPPASPSMGSPRLSM
jgi:uncharacterized repeat protein (TIGR03803 family)